MEIECYHNTVVTAETRGFPDQRPVLVWLASYQVASMHYSQWPALSLYVCFALGLSARSRKHKQTAYV